MNLVAKVEFIKMSTQQWFIETKSDIQAQRNFRRKYGRKPPARPSIRACIKSLWRMVGCYRERELADLNYQKKKLNLCKWHTPKALESRGISTQLQIPRSTIHKVLHRNLRFYAYKVTASP